MPSEHDTFAAAFSAPFLAEQFGERDQNGDPLTRKYLPPQNADSIAIVGGVLGSIEGGQEENAETGDIVARERRTWRILTSQLMSKGVKHLQHHAMADLGDQGHWAIELEQSRWGEVFVLFSLVREPLVTMKEFNGASV